MRHILKRGKIKIFQKKKLRIVTKAFGEETIDQFTFIEILKFVLNKTGILFDIKAGNPYPDDIFTEPTHEEWLQVQTLFRNAGLIQDRYFGSFGRRVWNNCLKGIENKLNETDA